MLVDRDLCIGNWALIRPNWRTLLALNADGRFINAIDATAGYWGSWGLANQGSDLCLVLTLDGAQPLFADTPSGRKSIAWPAIESLVITEIGQARIICATARLEREAAGPVLRPPASPVITPLPPQPLPAAAPSPAQAQQIRDIVAKMHQEDRDTDAAIAKMEADQTAAEQAAITANILAQGQAVHDGVPGFIRHVIKGE